MTKPWTPASETLRLIAETVLEIGWDKPVTVGHCCSLSTQDEARAGLTRSTLSPRPGLNIVSLPMCNLYLQDRHAGRTPRNRGITLVHEMVARGINVSLRLGQHPRSVLCLWRHGHDRGHAASHADRPSRSQRTDWPSAFLWQPLEGHVASRVHRPCRLAHPPISSSRRATGPSSSLARNRTASFFAETAARSTRTCPTIPNSTPDGAHLMTRMLPPQKAALPSRHRRKRCRDQSQKPRFLLVFAGAEGSAGSCRRRFRGVAGTQAEVIEVLKTCYAHDCPVTTRGAGTGNYGQAMPLAGGCVMHLRHMDR